MTTPGTMLAFQSQDPAEPRCAWMNERIIQLLYKPIDVLKEHTAFSPCCMESGFTSVCNLESSV